MWTRATAAKQTTQVIHNFKTVAKHQLYKLKKKTTTKKQFLFVS